MIEKITLDMLTQDSVSIKKQQYISQDGVEYPIEQPWRIAYMNSIQGRKQLENEVVDPHKSVIFMLWGDKPTIIEENA